MIEVHGVVRRYRRHGAPALDGVDLELPAGRDLALVGSSGAGKSTLLRVLLGLEPADAGTVRVLGRPVAPGSARSLRWLRAAVGVVAQDAGSSLDPRWPVGRSVAEPLRLLDLPGDPAARVREVLTAVDVDPGAADRRPAAFSGGQRQRIALARALVHRPTLLVADELLSGADAVLRGHLLALLTGLGTQLLLVTHDLALAGALAGDVAVLAAGRVVEHGPAVDVLRAPVAAETRLLRDAVLRLPA
ncbi:peptide/nickel transport system ATP-binding protein [Klenkia soli]|uniref:Peptide/nickel transport system ATP-binding protein n=1 Tax=Klenkia soli TaxID=1052260 RepID=A0A1H0RSG6_9ACTN|nr:ATP-binding cassette domain-containing protein [Klenkia soli]SDP32462.1 peptide/nickel transport system ATP-binding protein [Klenkia soli]